MSATTTPTPASSAAAASLYAQPSDVTLIDKFLRPWVTSGDTTAGGAQAYVHAADLYSADPERLARRFRPAVSVDGDRTWYFLSPLRAKSPRDRRKVRAVADGTGCWHSEAVPRHVVDHLGSGRHVGYRQSFSFMRRAGGDGGGVEARAGWIMAEFHLHHDGLGRKVEGMVLCKMYRSPRRHGGGPPVAVALAVGEEDDDVRSGVSLSAETTVVYCEKSKAGDGNGEDSSAVTPRWHWHSQHNSGGAATATAMTTVADLRRKEVSDDEVSVMTTAMAPCTKKNKVVEDDEDLLLALQPSHKKMRVVDADAEDSGAAAALNKAPAAGAPSAEVQLHCPQCGFHLAALQALVTLTASKLIVPQGDAADSELTTKQPRRGI